MNSPDFDNAKPQIVYPCLWVYAVIGAPEDELRADIAQALLGRHYKLELSKQSAHGAYFSFHIETRVENEEERNKFYQALKVQPHVKMVL